MATGRIDIVAKRQTIERRVTYVQGKANQCDNEPYMDFCEKHGPDSLWFEVEECNDCCWRVH